LTLSKDKILDTLQQAHTKSNLLTLLKNRSQTVEHTVQIQPK